MEILRSPASELQFLLYDAFDQAQKEQGKVEKRSLVILGRVCKVWRIGCAMGIVPDL